MKIAIKFENEKAKAWKCPCEDLKELKPSSEGFELYETELDISDLPYFKLVNNKIVLDTERKQFDEHKLASYKEIQSIQNWFRDYDRKVSEHSRCARLNIPCHHDIAMLDAEAVTRAARLTALKTEARS